MSTQRVIDPGSLRELTGTEAAPRLLDVRTPGEFETVHIPGAYNVPLDTLREHRAELLHHLDEDVVLVCRSGARAGQAGQALADVGLPQVRVLEGGMLAWEQGGGEVRRGRPRWDLERQVRLVAGSLVLLGVLGSLVVPWAVWLAGLVGGGLTVAALTNTCVMGSLLARLPYNRGPAASDLDTITAQLAGTPQAGGLRSGPARGPAPGAA